MSKLIIITLLSVLLNKKLFIVELFIAYPNFIIFYLEKKMYNCKNNNILRF